MPFAAPPSSSWQPPLSCKQLYSFRLHFTSGLHFVNFVQHPYVSFRLHSFQQLAVHRLPIIGSPAGRHRLRGCHGFCMHGWYNRFLSGSHAKINKNTRQPLAASSSHPPASSLSLSVCHRWLHSQTARAEKNKTSARHCTRFVFKKRQHYGKFNPLPQRLQHLETFQKSKSRIIIIIPYTKHNSKVTGLVANADKGSLRQSQKIFLFLLQKPRAKQKEYFLACPCSYGPQPVDTRALCFVASFVVNWVAGGCSFTSTGFPVFASISCVIPVGTTLSSCGFRSR